MAVLTLQAAVSATEELSGRYSWNFKLADTVSEEPETLEVQEATAQISITVKDQTHIQIAGMFGSSAVTATVDFEKQTISIPVQVASSHEQYGDLELNGAYCEGGEWFVNQVVGYIGDDGVITFTDCWMFLTIKSGDYAGQRCTKYVVGGSTFTPIPAPELVVPPTDLEAEEYSMTYTDYNGQTMTQPLMIGFDGADVYVQGLCGYIPDTWVKGTMDTESGTVTIAANQYLGLYADYEFYFQPEDAVLNYNQEAQQLSMEGVLFTTYGDYYDRYYKNPVITKVVERAATPANPSISNLVNHADYGYFIAYNVPTVDTEGYGLVTSKLSFVIYTDTEHEVSELTFTPTTHHNLTEPMTVIPYGFTEGYDFYADAIFLNELYSADWNKLGIKTIYTGGGETHETGIQWFTVKKYAEELALDALLAEIAHAEELLADPTNPEGHSDLQQAILDARMVADDEHATIEDYESAVEKLKQAEETFVAKNQGITTKWMAGEQQYANNEEVTTFNIDNYISGVACQGEGSKAPAYLSNGNSLYLYADNSLTIKASPAVKTIKQITLTFASVTNAKGLTADVGTYKQTANKGIWKTDGSNISEVTFTRDGSNGNTRIKSIEVTYLLGEDTTGVENIEHSPFNIEHAECVHDLYGRRSDMQKGIRIVGNRKVIMK